jgi:hypothetical protein
MFLFTAEYYSIVWTYYDLFIHLLMDTWAVSSLLVFRIILSPVLVAHAYNPSYSGGRDQEDGSSKPARINSSPDSISKIPNTKKGWPSGSSGRVPA